MSKRQGYGGGGDDSKTTLDALEVLAEAETLRTTLKKHEDALRSTLKEVTTLRGVIRGLESTITSLQKERSALLEQLQAAKLSETELAQQVNKLAETCEQLTATLQRRGVENASRVVQLEERRRALEVSSKTLVDRLNSQLISTQHPISSVRPMPWSQIITVEAHPALAIRSVVLDDMQREEKLLSSKCPVFAEEDHLELLKNHLISPAGATPSEDDAVWRTIVARMYTVLSDRRKTLHVSEPQGPEEYLLRTRNQLVAEVVHLHMEIKKIYHGIEVLRELLSLSFAKGHCSAAETQIELLVTLIGDLDYALARAKAQLFTDADRLYHGLKEIPRELGATRWGGAPGSSPSTGVMGADPLDATQRGELSTRFAR